MGEDEYKPLVDVEKSNGGYELPKWYIPRRYNVAFLSFFAITLAYMMRSNLSIAILVMAQDFDWPLADKGLFLSSFFMGYITTQLVGGMAARKLGPKFMISFVIVVPSIMTMLIPLVAKKSEFLFVLCRVLTGVFSGPTFPTVFLILGNWVPMPEKSTTLAFVFAGVNIGTIIIDTVGPAIMNHLGWPFVFYISGGIGFIWLFFWLLTITSSPAQMKFIHPNETKYIEDSISHEHDHAGANEHTKINEKEVEDPHSLAASRKALGILARNKSFWNIVWCGFCLNWGSYIFLTWLPTYVHSELGFSVQWSGIIAITPNISNAIVSVISSKICDHLMVKGWNKLMIRKIALFFGCFLYIITLLLMAFREPLGISSMATVLILGIGSGASGLQVPGYTANIYDIAPYHPSLVVGISNTAGTIPGIVGVFLTGILLQEGWSWSAIWLLPAMFYGLAMVSSVLFMGVKRVV